MYNTANMDELAAAMIGLVSLVNSPRRDHILLREAGVELDRALFALLVAFSSATQDIVIDAYRIESAPERLQAAMAASVSAPPATRVQGKRRISMASLWVTASRA